MPDDATPDPVEGYRIVLNGEKHQVLFSETTARQSIALERATGWNEQRLFAVIEGGALGLEGLAVFVLLSHLQAGVVDPSWDQILDSIKADMDVEFERLRAVPEADDPGGV